MILWAMRKLGVEEWIVEVVQGMYENVRSRIGEGLSEEFEVKVGEHNGYVLSPLLPSSSSRLYHVSLGLKYLGKICLQITLSSLQPPWKNVSESC